MANTGSLSTIGERTIPSSSARAARRYRLACHRRMNQMMVAIRPTIRRTIAIREVDVAGQRLIACGNGISISPATGSLGIVEVPSLSTESSLDARPCAPFDDLRQQSQQMMQLVHGFFGSTQRQNRNAEITRPLKDAAQTGLAHIQNILTCAAMRDIERDLQFTVCDRHPSGCW